VKGALRSLARLVMIGALAVGAWFGYQWAATFLGSGFPTEIAGVPRSLAGGDQLKATIATWRSDVNVKARSQIYSSAISNNQDAFAVVKATPPAGGASPTELLRRLASEGSTIKLPLSRIQEEQVSGIDYTCVTGFDQATDCMWRDASGEVVIVMGGPTRDYGTTLTLTASAHDAL
jgi:hypothetical protein